MIQSQESIDMEKRIDFYGMMYLLGGSVTFDKKIRFRETPHMPTKYLESVDIKDDFDQYGLMRDTILQILRGLTNKNKL